MFNHYYLIIHKYLQMLHHPKKIVIFLFLTFNFIAKSQNMEVKLNWYPFDVMYDEEYNPTSLKADWMCKDCGSKIRDDALIPYYMQYIPLPNGETIDKINFSVVSTTEKKINTQLPLTNEDFIFNYKLTYEGPKVFLLIEILPIIKKNNQWSLIEKLKITYTLKKESPRLRVANKNNTNESVLNTGSFYKISVPSSGVYKLDRTFFEENNIPFQNQNLNQFKIYGNGGTPLTEIIANYRPDDLIENAILVMDINENNQLDGNDYILFYAEGPHQISTNNVGNVAYQLNPYSENSHYFITWDGGSGKRIQLANNPTQTPIRTITHQDFLYHHERELVNILKAGRTWVGETFSFNRNEFNFEFQLNGMDRDSSVEFVTEYTARSLTGSQSIMRITLNNTMISNAGIPTVSGSSDGAYAASPQYLKIPVSLNSSNINVKFEYITNSLESRAWLNYFSIVGMRKIKYYGGSHTLWFNKQSLTAGITRFELDNFENGVLLWDVTDRGNPANINLNQDGNGKSYFQKNCASTILDRFIFVNPSQTTRPTFVSSVKNQNLHAITQSDYLIITHPSFLSQAERLATFHQEKFERNVNVVSVSEIFNEFSSGNQDVTGIRDFVKMVYDRSMTIGRPLEHLLLFGGASYDYKNQVENNTNFVPIYEGANYTNLISAYCSDDYYAILDDEEGYWGNNADERMDINVGRLPVRNTQEASTVVNKILNYHSPKSFGNWVNQVALIADDGDNNVHVRASQEIDSLLRIRNGHSPEKNIRKIYLDTYKRELFGSGVRFPDANREIENSVNSGILVFNYIGHGGEEGLAHERIVTLSQLQNWTNRDKLFFFVTASCEVSRFDYPHTTSPACRALFNPNGGSIGSLSTSRAIYISLAVEMSPIAYNQRMLYMDSVSGRPLTLGEVYKQTMNLTSGNRPNLRNVLLLADPAMTLIQSEGRVKTTEINNKPLQASNNDTLKALSKMSIKGEVSNRNGSIRSNFNGTVFVTIFDKETTYRTLGQTARSPVTDFSMQDQVIFNGKVTAVNGKFEVQFIVPKDIAYTFGNGKISYYAHDDIFSASGYFNDLIVGGTADSIALDNTPPEVRLFLNDDSWVDGGVTHKNPLILAQIFDENGINTLGSGIGREMELVLDKGKPNEALFVVNEFYESDLNSYQSGTINYNLSNIEDGEHTLHLTVWDNYNNGTTVETIFNVMNEEEIQLKNVLNYPNPFTTFTTFHFDHNKQGEDLELYLNIYNVAGRVVKTAYRYLPSASGHIAEIEWDGRDEFGDLLGRGVYFYRLEIKDSEGNKTYKIQKLYLL